MLPQDYLQHPSASGRPAGEDQPRRLARGVRVCGTYGGFDGPRQGLQGEFDARIHRLLNPRHGTHVVCGIFVCVQVFPYYYGSTFEILYEVPSSVFRYDGLEVREASSSGLSATAG